MFDPFEEAEKAGVSGFFPYSCSLIHVVSSQQTTPFDATPPTEPPPPPPTVTQSTVVPLATSILSPAPSNDMLSTKLSTAEEKITLLEREKQRMQNVSQWQTGILYTLKSTVEPLP